MNFKEYEKKKVSKILQWEASEEYAQLCVELQKKRKLLVDVGLEFLQSYSVDSVGIRQAATRVEYAVGGNIHRGVYCPSPVYDLLNGKSYRGRVIKRVTAASKISHQFGFDMDGKFLYADFFRDGEVYSTEFFVNSDQTRYGITVNIDGYLEAMSEEVYSGNQLVQYTYALFLPDEDEYFCESIYVEKYYYDIQGLESCEIECFQPYVNALRKDYCKFKRKDGFLASYTCETYPLYKDNDDSFPEMRYLISVKRKA